MACTVFLSVVRLWLCFFFFFYSGSPVVMDTQHIQGEGVPPQAGEGQHHHRPDQRYLSLQPTHSLPLPFPKDYRTGSWEMDRPREWEPLESRWPAHCRGFFFFFIKRRLFQILKKDTGGFLWRDAHMCLLNQRLLLIEAGVARGPQGGLDLPDSWRQSQKSSAGPQRLQRLPLQTPEYHTTWKPRWHVDMQMSGV